MTGSLVKEQACEVLSDLWQKSTGMCWLSKGTFKTNQTNKFFELCDTNGDGKVSHDELATFYYRFMCEAVRDEFPGLFIQESKKDKITRRARKSAYELAHRAFTE